VAPGHPWARRHQPVTLRELASTPLLMREQGSGTRDAVWEALARVCQPAPPAAELGSAAAIKAAAAAGAAPAVLSRLMVTTELAEGRLVTVPLAHPDALGRQFRAIWRREQPPSGPAAALLAVATKR
jgi:DNA-binding transcriptional LysR family regulator